MSRDEAYLYDILDSARSILDYVNGKDWEIFSKDMLLQDAVVRRLEVIGEASGRISAALQERYSHLPWKEMKSTRNKIIHEYDAVQLDIVWDIVQEDLPALIIELEKITSAD